MFLQVSTLCAVISVWWRTGGAMAGVCTMDLGIRGKRAIVCASSRGLGRACAAALAQEGVSVVINGLDAERLKRVAGEIGGSSGVDVIPVAGDVGAPGTRDALLAACPEPDILVNNNAGPPLRDFMELSLDDMAAGVDANMFTPLAMIQATLAGMRARKFGRIINITSSSVLAPIPGLDLSSGARAGLTSFLAGVARQCAQDNVTINNILPGAFDTDRLKVTMAGAARQRGVGIEEIKQARAAAIPARRLGQPDEFGALCAYLASVHTGYITGQNMLIDGGAVQTAF